MPKTKSTTIEAVYENRTDVSNNWEQAVFARSNARKDINPTKTYEFIETEVSEDETAVVVQFNGDASTNEFPNAESVRILDITEMDKI